MTLSQDILVCVYIQGEDVCSLQVSHILKSKHAVNVTLEYSCILHASVRVVVGVGSDVRVSVHEHMRRCVLQVFCVHSCVFVKVCKVDEGHFDLQKSTWRLELERQAQVKYRRIYKWMPRLFLNNKPSTVSFFNCLLKS